MMKTNGIAAVMIHVLDSEAGLEWYSRAFPDAKKIEVSEYQFKCLNINGVNLEIVNYSETARPGDSVVVVDWMVEDFDQAIEHLIEIGATHFWGPAYIENGMRICKLKDPFGNLLGLRGH